MHGAIRQLAYAIGVVVRVPDVLQVLAFVGAVVAGAWFAGPAGLLIGSGVLFVIGGALRAMNASGGRR